MTSGIRSSRSDLDLSSMSYQLRDLPTSTPKRLAPTGRQTLELAQGYVFYLAYTINMSVFTTHTMMVISHSFACEIRKRLIDHEYDGGRSPHNYITNAPVKF